MISINNGKIRCKSHLFDLSLLECRKIITTQYANDCYQQCLNALPKTREHYIDQNAFDRTLDEITNEKRPAIVVHKPKKPLFKSRKKKKLSRFAFNEEYHLGSQLLSGLANKDKDTKYLIACNQQEDQDLENILAKYNNEFGVMKVIDDQDQHVTKGNIFLMTYCYFQQHYFYKTLKIKPYMSFKDKLDVKLRANQKYTVLMLKKLLDKDTQTMAHYLYRGAQNYDLDILVRRDIANSIRNGFTLVAIGLGASIPYTTPLILLPTIAKNLYCKSIKSKYIDMLASNMGKTVISPFQI